MVKVMGNLNRWVSRETVQEMLGWSPEDIDLLINGLSKSVAVAPNNLILINLNDLRNHLVSIKKLADPILEGSVSKKIKRQREAPKKIAPKSASRKIKKPKAIKMNRKERVAAGHLTGKQVAINLNIRYSDIHELIERYGLKAGKFGRGYYIRPEDLEEFISNNQDVINSLRMPEKQVALKEPEKVQETVKQEENEKEALVQEEETANDPEDDFVMPSFAGLSEGTKEAEETKQEDLPKEPAQSEAPEKENIKPEAGLLKEKVQEAENQEPVQNESKSGESIEARSDPQVEKEQIPEKEVANPIVSSYVTIKKCKHGCKTDDVAHALGLSIQTPIKWINNNAVRVASIPGPRGEEHYIDPESLRDFLLKERNTLVTFSETKIPRQMGGITPAYPH